MFKGIFCLGAGVLLAVAFLSGCAEKPLAKLDRTKYGRVAFSPTVKLPAKYAYSDATMQGTGTTTANFGLIGALVGSAVIAAEENAGRKHVAGVIEHSKVNVARSVQQHFQTEVDGMHYFTIVPQNPQATFKLEVISWGFGTGGPGKLAASLTLRAELKTPAGESAWKKMISTTSAINGEAKDFLADPQLYARAFEEAADVAAKKLTGEWE